MPLFCAKWIKALPQGEVEFEESFHPRKHSKGRKSLAYRFNQWFSESFGALLNAYERAE